MKRLFQEIPHIRQGELELRKLEPKDASSLGELVRSEDTYRYLPTFLFEKKYEDSGEVIERLYDECLEDSLILGIFRNSVFCGLIEVYAYRPVFHKASIGYRLLPRFWGMGTATGAVKLMTEYLLGEKNMKVVTASVMVENKASERVLEKAAFRCVLHSVPEDWGHSRPVKADKWIRTVRGYRNEYRFQ